MKRLILVRHGKSSWKHDLPDDERPLKKRAYKDADLVITGIKSVLQQKPFLWSSYATRALDSAKIFKEKLEIPDSRFEVKEELYTFDEYRLEEIIRSCDEKIDNLMIFGHNPAITETVNSLGDTYFDNVPTTGLCVIDFESDSWRDIKKGKTLVYLFPKNLR